jgi:Ca2+/H+ antiporter, TMEM165/GDT1 family
VLAWYVPALVAGFVITLLEMTEVIALVFALSAEHRSLAPGAAGALAGIAVVSVLAAALGTVLLGLPRTALLTGAALALLTFGGVLFRSTLRTYRSDRAGSMGRQSPPPFPSIQFGGGFAVGGIEATEVVVVLIALAAAGDGFSALVGALTAGAVLVVAAVLVAQQVRRIKVPWLKWGATAMLFTFGVFWAGEAGGVRWPAGELFLAPLFALALGAVRGGIEVGLRQPPREAESA